MGKQKVLTVCLCGLLLLAGLWRNEQVREASAPVEPADRKTSIHARWRGYHYIGKLSDCFVLAHSAYALRQGFQSKQI